MSINRIIKINEPLILKLNEENKKMLGSIVSSLSDRSVIKDSYALNKSIHQLILDMLALEAESINYADYTDKTPEEIADTILRDVPTNIFESLKLIFWGLLVYSLFALLPSLISPLKYFDSGAFILSAIYFSSFTVFLIIILTRKDFSEMMSDPIKKYVIVIFIIVGLVIGMCIFWFLRTPLIVNFSGRKANAFLVILLLTLAYIIIKDQNRNLWKPMMPLLLLVTTMGILSRFQILQPFFSSGIGRLSVWLFLLFLSTIQAILLINYFSKS